MSHHQEFSPKEVNRAWHLFDALHDLANLIWNHYEQPFLARSIMEAHEPPGEDIPYGDDLDDIPF